MSNGRAGRAAPGPPSDGRCPADGRAAGASLRTLPRAGRPAEPGASGACERSPSQTAREYPRHATTTHARRSCPCPTRTARLGSHRSHWQISPLTTALNQLAGADEFDAVSLDRNDRLPESSTMDGSFALTHRRACCSGSNIWPAYRAVIGHYCSTHSRRPTAGKLCLSLTSRAVLSKATETPFTSRTHPNARGSW